MGSQRTTEYFSDKRIEGAAFDIGRALTKMLSGSIVSLAEKYDLTGEDVVTAVSLAMTETTATYVAANAKLSAAAAIELRAEIRTAIAKWFERRTD